MSMLVRSFKTLRVARCSTRQFSLASSRSLVRSSGLSLFPRSSIVAISGLRHASLPAYDDSFSTPESSNPPVPRLVVFGIPMEATLHQLQDVLGENGIRPAYIDYPDAFSGRSARIAYLNFPSITTASDALYHIQQDLRGGIEIDDKFCRFDFATAKSGRSRAPTRVIAIGNIPENATREDLSTQLQLMGGNISRLYYRIGSEFESGYALATLSSIDEASNIVAENQLRPLAVDGQPLHMSFAEERPVKMAEPSQDLYFRDFFGTVQELKAIVGDQCFIKMMANGQGFIKFKDVKSAQNAIERISQKITVNFARGKKSTY